jgi:hypothetical protein
MSTRTLKLTSPAMRGADVERFQKDINAELGRWDISFRLDEDGVYGLETRDTAQSVCFGLGLDSPVMSRGATPAIRLKVRNRKLSKTEMTRYKARRDWRERLGKRLDGQGDAINASVAFARAMLGVTESPPGSNRGPRIDKWCRATGFIAGPWCGAFANAVLVAGGFADQEWLRFCPWIEQKAKGGEAGWSWHSSPKRGDLVLYGRSVAQHVGFVYDADSLTTIEGNTSSGPGGSQDNGGGVFQRQRRKDGSLNSMPIRGFARPPWSKVN